MSKIAIHGRSISKEAIPVVEEVINLLRSHDREIFVSQDMKNITHINHLLKGLSVYQPNEPLLGFEAVFSLGGDGTLLDTLTHIGSSMIPILGINLGRLGFLATISRDQIGPALEAYFNGYFSYDDRSLLQLNTSGELFDGYNYALNEFAILRKDTSAMIVVKCFIDEEYLNTYWADGLMVSTPTGSTGYSLSCGGPVVIPNTKNFIITPISPHNLNVRPLIISEESVLKFVVESRNQSYQISLDSRSEAISEQIELTIKRADFVARLIKIHGSSFLDTLRNKLTWGLDKRN